MSAAFIGLDLAKSVFQVHGVDVHGTEAVRRRQALISSITKRLIPIRMNRDVRHREKIGKVGMSINASVLALFRMSDVLGTGG
jgi:hypothetical protein